MSDSSALLADAVRRLAAAGVGNPRLDARLLWEHAHSSNPPLEGGSNLAKPNSGRGMPLASEDYPSPKSSLASLKKISTLPQGEGEILECFESVVVRRTAREPLAYITGHKEFWSLDFEVGPDTLIPRPETETIIEQALAIFPDRNASLAVLDLGTGTGCLLVAFLKEFPNTRGLGIDLSEKACAVSRRNAARHELGDRCEIRVGDWAATVTGPFDVILSNPPYIRTPDLAGLEPEVVCYEPIPALDGGPDGLDAYRVLAPELVRLLRPGGHALVEVGAGQSGEVAALMLQAGLEVVRIAPDLAGIPRVLTVRRIA